jgi:putative transposase
MAAFIDAHREEYGVEPICRVLQVAPSGYYALKAEQRDPSRRCARAQRDDHLREAIARVWRRAHPAAPHNAPKPRRALRLAG